MEGNLNRIGFIGLGVMGLPMAQNLLKASFEVTGYNPSPEAGQKLVATGGKVANNIGEVTEQSDIIITMLPTSATVEEVLDGAGGIFENVRPGQVVIDMSTTSPLLIRILAEKAMKVGITLLDAPVSGGDKGAIAGTLSIMVGGDETVYQRCLPVFEAMGKTVVYAGESGAGATIKACNQLVVALNYAALSEALVLGSKAGVDPYKILEALGGGLANSRVLELRGRSMVAHDFSAGGRLALHYKDLGIVRELARNLGVPLLATTLVEQMFSTLMQAGYADFDHSVLLLFAEKLANHRVE